MTDTRYGRDARRQAELLFEGYEAGNPESEKRIWAHFPRSVFVDPSLCRHVVAREEGCAGWMDLVCLQTAEGFEYDQHLVREYGCVECNTHFGTQAELDAHDCKVKDAGQ